MKLEQLYEDFTELQPANQLELLRKFRDQRTRALITYNKNTAGKEIKLPKARAKKVKKEQLTAEEKALMVKMGLTKVKL